MFTNTPLIISKLSLEERKKWRALIDKKNWICLEGKDPWGIETAEIFVQVAYHIDQPIGIALATFRPSIGHALLLELYVDPQYRHQEIGTQLVMKLEERLSLKNCHLVSCLYQSEMATTVYIEKIFSKLGWREGFPALVRCHFQALEFHPPWLHRSYKLPKKVKIFPWKKLTVKEKERLEKELENELIPPSMSPFLRQNEMEPINSLGLKKNGEVIGWMIVHRASENTLQYSALYIKPLYHFLGYSVKLLAASIILQQKFGIEKAFLEVNLEEADASWINFIKKRLIPGSCLIERFKESFHHLNHPSYIEDDRELLL